MQEYLAHIADEADAYFARNVSAPGQRDYVLEALLEINGLKPIEDLLEVGCMDGTRLAKASKELNCRATGIEASPLAAQAAVERFPDIRVTQGIAPPAVEAMVGVEDFDAVVVGFFLYLLPRRLLFRTAAAIDAVLRDGGFLVVTDFLSPFAVRRGYKHDRTLWTFKSDYAQAWSWNPQYTLISRRLRPHGSRVEALLSDEQNWTTVDILYKMPEGVAYAAK